MATVIKNNVQSKEFDMQQKKNEIALPKELSNEQFKALDKILQDDLNISNKINYDIFYESQNLPLALKCIEQKVQFQQGKKEFDTDCNKNITTNEEWKNIYDKLQRELQEINSASSQKVTKEEEVNKDMSEKFEHNIARISTITQLNIEENGATLSKRSVKNIKSLHEQLKEKNKEELKNIKSTQQQMTTNVKQADLKMINISSKIDSIVKTELMRQNAYLRFISAKDQIEIKRLRAQLQIHYNRCNMPDKKITPRTDFVMQKTNTMNKILELESEVLKLKFENQQYMKRIEKFCCNEEDICINRREYEDENSKNQKIKHEKYESNMQIKLMNRILMLYTEIKWWKQRFQRNQTALMTEKQKEWIELMKFITKITDLRNLRNALETEELNLLLQENNKNKKMFWKKSFNALTSQNRILRKESQQMLSEMNSISSNMQNTLEDQVSEIVVKDSDKDYITLPSVTWRQVVIKEGDFNYITLPTTKIADTKSDKTVKSPKQVDKDFNKDSLIKLLTDFEDKINNILKKDFVKIMDKLLEDLKTNDKSTVVEEQIPTLAKDYNKDCITSPSIMRQIEAEEYDYNIMPLPMNIADKGSDKAVESPKQVDKDFNKDALTEPLTDFKDKMNKILNKDFIKIIELLENLKTSDKSTVVEEQVSTLIEDFNKDCVTSPSIMQQIEEDYDYNITPSPTNIVDKESDKAVESPKQVDENYNKDSLTKLTDFKDKMNNIFKKNFVKIMDKLLEDLKTNDKSTVVEKQIPTLAKDFNKDCITSPSIMRQIEAEDYDYNIMPLPMNIADKGSDKAVESSKQVDKDFNKDALTEPLTDFKDKMNKILNKDFIKIIELLENLKTSDKSTVVEEQVPTLAEDFDEDCVRWPSIIRQIEVEDYDYDITPSPTNIADKESDKAVESPKQVDKNYNKDSLTESLTDFEDKTNEIRNKETVKVTELLENLETSDESTVVEEQVPTLVEDFDEDCVRSPSIIRQIEEEDYDYDIAPSPTNIADKELDKAMESPIEVDKDSNKDALTEPSTDFEDTTNEIQNKEIIKITELLENLKTSNESTVVEEQVPTLAEDFDEDCVRSPSIIRQIEEEDYDYDIAPSPTNIADKELDKAMESPIEVDKNYNKDSLTESLTDFEDKTNEIRNKETVKVTELLENLKTCDESTVVEEQVPTLVEDFDEDCVRSPSIIRKIEEEDYDYDISPSPTNIADKELDKPVESPIEVVKDSNKDALTEPSTDFEDTTNEIRNKETVKVTELLENLKTSDESTVVEEQVPTLAEDFDEDCVRSPSIIRKIEEEDYDYDITPSPTNIADKELDKPVESPIEVDKDFNKDALTESLADFEDKTNEIRNKETVKVTELLENLKTCDESTVVEEQVPTLVEDFDEDCVRSPSIIRQIEEEDYDYDITPSPTNIADKELDKAVESPIEVDKDSNKDALTEPLTDFEDKTNEIRNKETVKVTELLENLKTCDESTVVEEQVSTLAEDFDEYCVRWPSIIRQIKVEDYDYDITPSPTNIADKELDKAVESPIEVDKDSNKDALTEPLTDFEDKTNEIRNKETVKVMELLEYLKTCDESTVVEEQVSTLAEDFDEYCVRWPSIIRQIKVEDYDYDITLSPTNIADKELDKAVESPIEVDKDFNKDALTEPLTDFEDKTNEIRNKETVKVTELLENLKTCDESTVVEEQVSTLAEDFDEYCVRWPSIIRQIKVEDYDYDITLSPTNIADKELDKAVESPIEVDKDFNKDALTEPLTDFEDKTNEIRNKETVKVTKLLENLKTCDESIDVEEQVQNKDKVADGKKEAKRDDKIFKENLTFLLLFYESLLSSITKNQSIVKHMMDRVYQNQPADDYESFENCSFCKKLNEHTSQQGEKNQLGPNEIDANVNNNHIKCNYCNLAISILMTKYDNTIGHVNNVSNY